MNLQSVFWVLGVRLRRLAVHNFLALAAQCELNCCWALVVVEAKQVADETEEVEDEIVILVNEFE